MLHVTLAMPPSAAGLLIRLHAGNRSLQSAPRIRLRVRCVSVIACTYRRTRTSIGTP